MTYIYIVLYHKIWTPIFANYIPKNLEYLGVISTTAAGPLCQHDSAKTNGFFCTLVLVTNRNFNIF